MRTRLELHQKLIDILGSDDVYFDPPPSVYLSYPCIVYSAPDMDVIKADNRNYGISVKYVITFITKDTEPDNPTINSILSLPYTRLVSRYIGDNLMHNKFEIYI